MNAPRVSTVDQQWNECRKRLLPSVAVHSTQYSEMRKAFYAGFGQCLIVSRDEIGHPDRPDEEGAAVFQGLLDETIEFWGEEQKRYDASRGAFQ